MLSRRKSPPNLKIDLWALTKKAFILAAVQISFWIGYEIVLIFEDFKLHQFQVWTRLGLSRWILVYHAFFKNLKHPFQHIQKSAKSKKV